MWSLQSRVRIPKDCSPSESDDDYYSSDVCVWLFNRDIRKLDHLPGRYKISRIWLKIGFDMHFVRLRCHTVRHIYILGQWDRGPLMRFARKFKRSTENLFRSNCSSDSVFRILRSVCTLRYTLPLYVNRPTSKR
jgi:hypothetical protein